jgi:hypothetical protein
MSEAHEAAGASLRQRKPVLRATRAPIIDDRR